MLACIYTFPVDMMMTESEIQRITWRIKVFSGNCLALFFSGGVNEEFCKGFFFLFLLTLLALCPGISTCLHYFGWSDALSSPLGLFSPDKCSSFSQTDRNQSSDGQFHDISCLTIDSVFIGQLRFHYRGNDRGPRFGAVSSQRPFIFPLSRQSPCRLTHFGLALRS